MSEVHRKSTGDMPAHEIVTGIPSATFSQSEAIPGCRGAHFVFCSYGPEAVGCSDLGMSIGSEQSSGGICFLVRIGPAAPPDPTAQEIDAVLSPMASRLVHMHAPELQ